MPLVVESIFGVNSILMETTPRQFLFDGVNFCQGQDELSQMVCGLIMQNAPTTIKVNEDGSLRFSMFAHVSVASALAFSSLNIKSCCH